MQVLPCRPQVQLRSVRGCCVAAASHARQPPPGGDGTYKQPFEDRHRGITCGLNPQQRWARAAGYVACREFLLQAYAAGTRLPETPAEAPIAFGLVYGCSHVWLPLETHRLALSAALPLAAAARQCKLLEMQSGDSGPDKNLHPVR